LVLHVVRGHSWTSFLFMPNQFIHKFVFVQGQEKCFERLGRITSTLGYYLKDLSIVHLKFGSRFHLLIEDHRFIIDDEPNKVIINSQYNQIFFEAFNEQMSISNIQGMDQVAFICGHSSKVSLGLLLWKTIIHKFDDSFVIPCVFRNQIIIGSSNTKRTIMKIL